MGDSSFWLTHYHAWASDDFNRLDIYMCSFSLQWENLIPVHLEKVDDVFVLLWWSAFSWSRTSSCESRVSDSNINHHQPSPTKLHIYIYIYFPEKGNSLHSMPFWKKKPLTILHNICAFLELSFIFDIFSSGWNSHHSREKTIRTSLSESFSGSMKGQGRSPMLMIYIERRARSQTYEWTSWCSRFPGLKRMW